MDISWGKGPETLQHEDEAIRLWNNVFPTYRYIHTPKNSPAKADAIMLCDNQLRAVVETKCRRKMGYDTLMTTFKGEWLVTHQKILDCVQVAELLHLPFVGMLYLVDERTLLYKVIWQPGKGYITGISVRNTETQKTVNGGRTVRANAFIDMRDAHVIRGAEQEEKTLVDASNSIE